MVVVAGMVTGSETVPEALAQPVVSRVEPSNSTVTDDPGVKPEPRAVHEPPIEAGPLGASCAATVTRTKKVLVVTRSASSSAEHTTVDRPTGKSFFGLGRHDVTTPRSVCRGSLRHRERDRNRPAPGGTGGEARCRLPGQHVDHRGDREVGRRTGR